MKKVTREEYEEYLKNYKNSEILTSTWIRFSMPPDLITYRRDDEEVIKGKFPSKLVARISKGYGQEVPDPWKSDDEYYIEQLMIKRI